MAYYLEFDGVDDHVTTSGFSAIPSTFDLECDFESVSMSRQALIHGEGGGHIEWQRASNSITGIANINSGWRTLTASGYTSIGRYKVRLIYDGTLFSLSVDGDIKDSLAISGAIGLHEPYVIGKHAIANRYPLYGNLYNARITTNYAAADYDPSASGGTGSILPDTVGGNNGTLVNFPTDNSQWVFYSAPSAGVTASSAFTLPKLTLSASGSATLPQPSASGAFSFQPISISSSGSATLPQPEISGAFSVPILSASGSASATLPQPSISGAFSYPVLTVSASGSATTTNADINGNITFNKFTVSGNASATLPQPDVIGAFSLPKLTIDGTASAIIPQPIINGNINLSKLTISANGTVTLPQPVANGSFSLPLITTRAFATVSGLDLIIDPKTNINQVALSANINQVLLSANINQTNLSNNIVYN